MCYHNLFYTMYAHIQMYMYVYLGKKRFVFPTPRDACSDIENTDKITEVCM